MFRAELRRLAETERLHDDSDNTGSGFEVYESLQAFELSGRWLDIEVLPDAVINNARES